MRNCYPFILIVFLFTAIISCKKNGTENTHQSGLLSEAKAFFYSDVRPKNSLTENGVANNPYISAAYGREPLWDFASQKNIAGKIVLVAPMKYDSLFYVSSSKSGNRHFLISDVARLCVYKDSLGQFHAEVVTVIPDDNYITGNKKSFSGFIHVDAWDGTPLHSYLFNSNNVYNIHRSSQISSAHATISENSIAENSIAILETCYYFEGYNYSPVYDEGYAYEEELGCDYEVISDGGDSGGGLGSSGYSGASTGGGGSSVTVRPVVSKPIVGGNNIIANIKDYDKCFTNSAGNTYSYSVTVCVDQPVPGTRDPWGFSVTGSSSGSNLVNVGHTFLIFTQSGPNGTIQRNVGFYPEDMVLPTDANDSGELNNDYAHNYNISLTISLNNSQFFNMLNYVSSEAYAVYNLNTYNCTTFALYTLGQGGVDILSRQGTWAGGGGYDPGD